MKKKHVIIQLSIAALLFIFSLSGFLVLHSYINKKNKEALDSEKSWSIEEARRANVKTLELFLEDEIKERNEIDKHFVKNTDIVSFLNTIEGLAPKAGAVAEVTLIDVPKDGAGLMVGVNSKGSFESIYKFLSLLENAPYELDFSSVSLKIVRGGEGESNTWQATFKIQLLSFI